MWNHWTLLERAESWEVGEVVAVKPSCKMLLVVPVFNALTLLRAFRQMVQLSRFPKASRQQVLPVVKHMVTVTV